MKLKKAVQRLLASVALAAPVVVPGVASAASDVAIFGMVPSSPACLPDAKAGVSIQSIGPIELMTITASGLLPDAEYDLFITQLPRPPFGLSWYQGDMTTDSRGRAIGTFIGRFSQETFIIAPGSGAAPIIHPGDDAATNPATAPIHTFHLGLWFNSPDDAIAAGCPGIVTPFNGDHSAGIQVLNTGNVPDDRGPLRKIVP